MTYALVITAHHRVSVPHDPDSTQGDDTPINGPWRNVKQATARGLSALSITTETVFSTTTVHVTPIPTTSFSISESLLTNSASETPGRTIQVIVSSTADIMTGIMFCAATDHSNNVYTPCPYVYTNQPGMVGATDVPNSAVATSAGRRRAHNPYETMLKRLSRWFEINSELAFTA